MEEEGGEKGEVGGGCKLENKKEGLEKEVKA